MIDGEKTSSGAPATTKGHWSFKSNTKEIKSKTFLNVRLEKGEKEEAGTKGRIEEENKE